MFINLTTIDLCPTSGGAKQETTFSVEPSTQAQTIVPEEGYVFSSGTVAAVDSTIDSNIVPGNIKSGISILGVQGTVNPQKPEDVFNVTPSTVAQTVTPQSGHVFSSGTVAAVTSTIDSNITPGNIKSGITILGVQGTVNPQKLEETFSITPRTTDLTVTPQEGYVFSSGVVTAVTSEIDANIVPENIRTGVSILGVTGNVSPAKSEETFTVNPSTQAQTITPQSGYTFSSGTVAAVTSSIDQNIVPSNIKDGVEILGVTGTYTGGSGRDYRNQTGTTTGLADLGWDADSIGYYQANAPHYSWQDADYTVTQANKDLYGVVNKNNKGDYQNNTDMEYVPMFDTTGVTSMDSYFLNFSNIKGIPILDTSSVTDMGDMFANCTSLTTIPILDTSSVTRMYQMFYNCTSLTTIPILDTSSVMEMYQMFYNCTSLTTIPLLDTSSVTGMGNMFQGCSSLTAVPALDTSSVTFMSQMFNGCSKLTTIPALNTSSVTDMSYMFQSCYSLTTIPLLDTSSVTNMTSMFSGCSSLTTIPALNTSSVTDMNYMFEGCTRLTAVPALDTSSVTDMTGMFFSCSSLTAVPALDTSSVTNMLQMFFNCRNLTTIPALDTSSVTNMGDMFSGCSSLTTINGIDFSSMTDFPSYFLDNVGSTITRFIVNGKIDFTWDTTDGLYRLTNIDFDSVKSILQAMSRTTNTNAKTMKLNRTINDNQDGDLMTLKTQCESKGWTITGLTILEEESPVEDGEYYYVGDLVTYLDRQMYELHLTSDDTLVGYAYYDENEDFVYYYDTYGNCLNTGDSMFIFDLYLEENGLAG